MIEADVQQEHLSSSVGFSGTLAVQQSHFFPSDFCLEKIDCRERARSEPIGFVFGIVGLKLCSGDWIGDNESKTPMSKSGITPTIL